MNDDELRSAFHDLADGRLPIDFTDQVLAALPARKAASSRRPLTFALAGLGLATVIAAVALSRPAPVGDVPTPTAEPSPDVTAIPSPDAAEGIVLTVEITPGGAAAGSPDDDRPNEMVFSLQGNRAVYRDYDWGTSRSEERVAYLTPAQVEELVEFAIGPGGMAEAQAEYPRNSLGPSGQTIITLVSPELTKTVTYGLGPGNLTRDQDPALGGLPDLVERLGHFSTEVERGNASGGLPLDDVDRAIGIALGDPRLSDLLAPGGHVVERVIAANLEDTMLVFLVLGDDQTEWPEIDVCESSQASGGVTGVVWLVSLDENRVLAVSPRWDSFDCLNPLYDEFVLR